MDIRQMQYFVCLAQEGNVTRAARRLSIVQPALSMQIAKLESSLGKKLFHRGAQGMTLTPAGETLFQIVDPILKDIDRAKETMSQLDGKVSGRVSIGMIASVAQSTLPLSSAKIAAHYPEIHLLVCEGYTESILEWVAASQLDLAVVNIPQRRIMLSTKHILDEQMMLAHSAAVDLGLPKNVPYTRLAELDVVIPSRRHGLRRILDDAAAEAGFTLNPRLEIDTLSAISEVVATTGLATVLPGIALQAMLKDGRIKAHRLQQPTVVRSLAWVSNPRRLISSAMSAVMNIITADLQASAKSASRLAAR
jgi:DNA-binding transcriptional LysR family regulator